MTPGRSKTAAFAIGSDKPLSVTLRWDERDEMAVGQLAYRDGVAYLEYDADFLSSGLQISPVYHPSGPGLLKPANLHVFEGLHGVFNDSLPDGWGRLLLDRRARQLGIDPARLTPLDRLACVGTGGIGALCYEPAVDPWDVQGRAIDLNALASDARSVLEGEAGEVIGALGRAGGSPGGARPKVLIALNADGHAVHGVDRIDLGYDHYIVKFLGRDDPDDIAFIEAAYAAMATDSGIEMPETRLFEDGNGGAYFGARRFDRDGNRRTHVHSASGLLYADIRIPAVDYESLVRLTRHVTRDQRDCTALYRLAVFNVLAHNRDDHARQFSYRMTRDGTWRLAPAYDLTFASGPGGEHSTSVLGHGRNIDRKTLMALGRKADLGEKSAREIIEQVAAVVADWESYAGRSGVSRASMRLITDAIDGTLTSL